MKLADAASDIFGKIKSPPGTPTGSNPISLVLTLALRIFFVVAGLTALFYLLLGAFDWITSGGDKEKLGKARAKIQNAIIGLLLFFVVIALMTLLERAVFNCRLCFGLSCPFHIPAINEPTTITSCR